MDGKKWNVLVDKSNNKTDVPHDYVELEKPVQARFIKLENIHMPTGKFAISGLRVFGNGNGAKPGCRAGIYCTYEQKKINAVLL